MNNFPRFPTGRGPINAVLVVLCFVFVLMVVGLVALFLWLIGQLN